MDESSPVTGSATGTESDAIRETPDQKQVGNEDHIKFGIFNSEKDLIIANRLVDKLRSVSCEAERFDKLLIAGEPKMQCLEDFIQSHDVCIWIASSTSLEDEGMMTECRHIAHHASVAQNVTKFIVFQPAEYLDHKLPSTLDAYTPLIEDESYNERLKATLKHIRKKKEKHRRRMQSTAEKCASSAMACHDDSDTIITTVEPDTRQESVGLQDASKPERVVININTFIISDSNVTINADDTT